MDESFSAKVDRFCENYGLDSDRMLGLWIKTDADMLDYVLSRYGEAIMDMMGQKDYLFRPFREFVMDYAKGKKTLEN